MRNIEAEIATTKEIADALVSLRCVQNNDDCKGDVEYRDSLSATGVQRPRCDFHWEWRLDEHERIMETYYYDPRTDV